MKENDVKVPSDLLPALDHYPLTPMVTCALRLCFRNRYERRAAMLLETPRSIFYQKIKIKKYWTNVVQSQKHAGAVTLLDG